MTEAETGTLVHVQLVAGMHFEAFGGNAVSVHMDSSAGHGGEGAGPTPMELVLISLGGCTGMDVLSILRKKRQEITDYRVDVRGVQVDEYPRVFKEIAVHHTVRAHGATEDAVRRAIELSETKYCSVYAMLEKTATIVSSFEILPATPSD